MSWKIPTAFAIAVGMAGVQGEGLTRAQAKESEHKGRVEAHPGDGLLGEWWTEGREGRVRFERHRDGTYKGITTWRAPKPATEDNPDKDIHNPDPNLRGRSTTGIVLIWDLTYKDGRYQDGHVYNPRNGGVYGFEAELISRDLLKIRGYMGLRLFGKNQIWKRYVPGR